MLAIFVNLSYFHITIALVRDSLSRLFFISLGANKRKAVLWTPRLDSLPHLFEQWRHLNEPPRSVSSLNCSFKFVRLSLNQHPLIALSSSSMSASLFSLSWPAPVVTSVLSCAIVVAIFSQRACLSPSFGFCHSTSRFYFRPFLRPYHRLRLKIRHPRAAILTRYHLLYL